MRRALLATLAAAACAAALAAPPDAPREPARAASPAAGASGGLETGRLTSAEQAIGGPFVLTYLTPGAQLEVVSTGPNGAVVGRIEGPLAAPFQLGAGMLLRVPPGGDAVYSGHRPAPITRPLDAWLGRPVLLAVGGAQPEPWTLRAIGEDHFTVERSRTYRVVPVRRIAEITWTELTGMDPTPRIVLARE